MKGDYKWKQNKYLQACRILDAINKDANFCNIRNTINGIKCNGEFSKREDLCCQDCWHITDKGCSVQSLGCKLSYCYINCKPSDCIKLNLKQKIKEKRFLYVKELIKKFFVMNNIPLLMRRASMQETFSLFAE